MYIFALFTILLDSIFLKIEFPRKVCTFKMSIDTIAVGFKTKTLSSSLTEITCQ